MVICQKSVDNMYRRNRQYSEPTLDAGKCYVRMEYIYEVSACGV